MLRRNLNNETFAAAFVRRMVCCTTHRVGARMFEDIYRRYESPALRKPQRLGRDDWNHCNQRLDD